jgi:hypothetical protein
MASWIGISNERRLHALALLAWSASLGKGRSEMTTDTCVNCGEPIRHTPIPGFPDGVWDHHTHDNHTVCNWREDMEPTCVVATPRPKSP